MLTQVSEAENGSCSVLKLETEDRPGLLVDIVRVLKDVNMNVSESEGRRARCGMGWECELRAIVKQVRCCYSRAKLPLPTAPNRRGAIGAHTHGLQCRCRGCLVGLMPCPSEHCPVECRINTWTGHALLALCPLAHTGGLC